MLKEGLRYFVVVVIGLGVDVGLAWWISRVTGLPLELCAAFGFLAGVAANYVMFEMWVFATGRLSFARLGKAYAAALGALAVRLAAVWALSRALARYWPDAPYGNLVILALAAGLSFIVNFALVRPLLRSR